MRRCVKGLLQVIRDGADSVVVGLVYGRLQRNGGSVANMVTTSILPRNKGMHPEKRQVQQSPPKKGFALPEYLEAHQVQAVIAAAPNPRARLLMLLQWRAGLRVSEALALEAADLWVDTEQPTIRVRHGKGRRTRMLPVHPELQNALGAVMHFSDVGEGRVIPVSRSTAWRWVQAATQRAVALAGLPRGKRVGTHIFRHSYARYLLLHGVPINYLSRWLRHNSIQSTLVYLELVPDPSGRLATVP